MPNKRKIGLLVIAVLTLAMWWELLDSRAPEQAAKPIPLSEMRARLVATPLDQLPKSIDLIEVGRQAAPALAVEAGGGFGEFEIAFTAFDVRYDNSNVVIDAAVDQDVARRKTKNAPDGFDPDGFRVLTERLHSAQRIALTHEHDDHATGLLAQSDLEALLQRTYLPETQRAGLNRLAGPDKQRVLANARWSPAEIAALAPGVVVAPMAGHTPGSMLVLARLRNGREYLFIGDISWSRHGIAALKTRPRILQWLFFEPDEDRPAILSQLRALHDLAGQKGAPIIVPSHDQAFLQGLVDQGLLGRAGHSAKSNSTPVTH